MTLISQWGPIMWNFLHTIVESIHEEHYNKVHKDLFQYIKSICGFLPCPTCANHAKEYLKRVRDGHISTKDGFRNVLFNFHNDVNKRTKKQQYKVEDLDKYKTSSLVNTYNQFFKLFTKKGNLQQINQSFQRKLISQNFIQWLKRNQYCFQIK